MTNEFANQLKTIKRELLELKTAQLKPSIMATYIATVDISAVTTSTGPRSYTIHYKNALSQDDPVTYHSAFALAMGVGIFLRPYNSTTNTQDIWIAQASAQTLTIMSTRAIDSITANSPMPNPTPVPAQQWTQVRDFYPADMGTAPGWCLQNCRLGFHIYSGTYQTARADMQAQSANGTLHSLDSLPNYLAVPVYIDTGIPEGHIGVYDHGTFYSDGAIINNWISYYGAQNIWGWGELCDGARVVEHV